MYLPASRVGLPAQAKIARRPDVPRGAIAYNEAVAIDLEERR